MRIFKHGFVRALTTILACVAISYLLSLLTSRVNFLERFSTAITDIDFSDLYYRNRSQHPKDSNIVLINIGYSSRGELAQLIKTISDNNPRAIGLDIFFGEDNDSLDVAGTNSLSNVFSSINNVVAASAYLGKDREGMDLVARQSPFIRQHVIESLVNLNIATDDPEMGTVRSFNPVTDVNGYKQLSFGYSIASFWNKDISANDDEGDMFIRWYGYVNRNEIPDSLAVFRAFDAEQILNEAFLRKDIENKIVLVGFLGKSLDERYDPIDQMYSPLNHKVIGRSFPDIYGLEIHANIVKMIIDNDFIYHSRLTRFYR